MKFSQKENFKILSNAPLTISYPNKFLHSKTPIPLVTYQAQWLHSDHHCDDVVTVL